MKTIVIKKIKEVGIYSLKEPNGNTAIMGSEDVIGFLSAFFNENSFQQDQSSRPDNARCVCPNCGQPHDPKLIDGGAGQNPAT